MYPLTEAQIQEIFQLIESYPNSKINSSEVLLTAAIQLNQRKQWEEVITELTTLISSTETSPSLKFVEVIKPDEPSAVPEI